MNKARGSGRQRKAWGATLCERNPRNAWLRYLKPRSGRQPNHYDSCFVIRNRSAPSSRAPLFIWDLAPGARAPGFMLSPAPQAHAARRALIPIKGLIVIIHPSASRTLNPLALLPAVNCWAIISRPLCGLINPLALLPAVNCWATISRPLCGLINPLIDQENASAIVSIRVRAAGSSSPTVARKFGCVIPDPR